MFCRCICVFLIICSFIISSEEKEASCQECLPFMLFQGHYYNFFTRTTYPITQNLTRKESYISYPYNLLRLLAIVYSGSTSQTRAEFEKLIKLDLKRVLHNIELYESCIKKKESHKVFKVIEKGYFGLSMNPGINKFYFENAERNFGIDFWKKAPFKLPSEVANKLRNDAKDITNNRMENFFKFIMKDGINEGFIYGGHHLKLNWRTPFSYLENDDFGISPTTSKKMKAKVMKIRMRLPHALAVPHWPFRVIALPFKEDRYSMILHLGSSKINVYDVIKKFKDTEDLTEREPLSFRYINITLLLPKIKIELKDRPFDFTPVMKNKEVKLNTLVDQSNSNLTCMSPAVYVNSVKMGTFFEIDGKKVESSALMNFLIYPKNSHSGRKALKPEECFLAKPKPNINDRFCDTTQPDSEIQVIVKPEKKKEKIDGVERESDDNSKSSEEKTDSYEYIFDARKPFNFFILDRHKGLPLIYGKIGNPLGK